MASGVAKIMHDDAEAHSFASSLQSAHRPHEHYEERRPRRTLRVGKKANNAITMATTQSHK
eukprot:6203547-Pleurochrysis_carterae.AAC.1